MPPQGGHDGDQGQRRAEARQRRQMRHRASGNFFSIRDCLGLVLEGFDQLILNLALSTSSMQCAIDKCCDIEKITSV